MASTYILKPNGKIQAEITLNNLTSTQKSDLLNVSKDDNDVAINKDNEIVTQSIEIPNEKGYIIAVETLSSFKAGKNLSGDSDKSFIEVYDGIGLNIYDNVKNSVIGKSTDLYPYAHGNSIVLKSNDDNQKHIEPEALPFYTAYNSFFDLDERLTGNKGYQLFATDLDFAGVPQIYSEPSEKIDDLQNVAASLIDILVAASIPIITMSLLQGAIQFAQSGPLDPFGFLPKAKLASKDYDYGRYITYNKIDPIESPTLAPILNPVIEAAISLLNVMERLMGFPKFQISSGKGFLNTFKQIGISILKNITNFVIGYISYLVPGFKLSDNIARFDSIANAIGFFVDAFVSLTLSDKSKHNYNLLVRKVVRNKYFRDEIINRARTTTDKNGEDYTYLGQSIVGFTNFFYKFIGQRISAGHATLEIFSQSKRNKKNQLFAVTKMNELPVEKTADGNNVAGVGIPSIGASVLSTGDESNTTNNPSNYFNRSVYSLTSIIRADSTGKANSYMDYHNALVEQTKSIVDDYKIRLSQEHVEKMEKLINADYMPFSIQDLRTNEVFKFHAFLEGFTDTFQPDWEDAGKGFGRMDSIKIYKGTSRTISVDFYLIAMNPEDFDNMWYMVNRLIALIYPQWSKPIDASTLNQEMAGIKHNGTNIPIPFKQPFTQIPVSSPIIRLRLGDLFTSNYSKKNLARIFGFDEDKKSKIQKIDTYFPIKFNDLQSDIFNKILIITDYNKQQQPTDQARYTANLVKLQGYTIIDLETYNSYLNGVNRESIFFGLHQEDFSSDNREFNIHYYNHEVLNNNYQQEILKKDSIQKLFVNYSNFYWNNDIINLDDINNPSHDKDNSDEKYPSQNEKITNYYKLLYIPVSINEDGKRKVLILLCSVKNTNFFMQKSSEFKQFDIKEAINNIWVNLNYYIANQFLNDELKDIKENERIKKNRANVKAFMASNGEYSYDEKEGNISIIKDSQDAINNPIVKAFESNMGEGLAGTVGTFNLNYDLNIPWQLEEGNRAPMAVKVSMNMSVIHDILPGLDHNGIMRAPTYRVGAINRNMFGGSVRDDLPGTFTYTESPSEKK